MVPVSLSPTIPSSLHSSSPSSSLPSSVTSSKPSLSQDTHLSGPRHVLPSLHTPKVSSVESSRPRLMRQSVTLSEAYDPHMPSSSSSHEEEHRIMIDDIGKRPQSLDSSSLKMNAHAQGHLVDNDERHKVSSAKDESGIASTLLRMKKDLCQHFQ
jgi:hypothetical protein